MAEPIRNPAGGLTPFPDRGRMLRPLGAIVWRDLKRMARERGRLVSALVRPLLWLVIIGSGFEAFLGRAAPGDYHAFLVPGLLGMVLLFGAMLASLSLVYDKESGVMRMLLAAPVARGWIVVARTLSAAVVAVAQSLMLVVVLLPLGYFGGGISIGILAGGLLATGLTCATLGMLIAVWAKGLENFAVIMNFVIFPVFFLSGALYPLEGLPSVLLGISSINPFSYGVDMLKHAMLTDMGQPFAPDFSLLTDAAVLSGFVVIGTALAALRFSTDSVREGLAALISTRRNA